MTSDQTQEAICALADQLGRIERRVDEFDSLMRTIRFIASRLPDVRPDPEGEATITALGTWLRLKGREV